MATWKKSFKSLPPQISAELERLGSENVKVLAGKLISVQDVADGSYAQLDLTPNTLEVGRSWQVVPPAGFGKQSKKNAEGWVHVRRDLPKFKKYSYRDIQNFGDASRNGWSTVAIPREVYERDEYPPYLFHLEVFVKEQKGNGKFGVVFSIDEIFLTKSPKFESDILFAVNLLQETSGVSGVVAAEDPDFVFTDSLDWEIFPPGDLDDVIARLCSGRMALKSDSVRERLELFQQFQPTEYLRGLGGNDYYIGAKYADDLVVFENLKYGNALYALYKEWRELSQQPRSELLKLRTSQFDRIVHTQGWETRFALMMQTELKKRGIRIPIGRNLRRGLHRQSR